MKTAAPSAVLRTVQSQNLCRADNANLLGKSTSPPGGVWPHHCSGVSPHSVTPICETVDLSPSVALVRPETEVHRILRAASDAVHTSAEIGRAHV